MADPQSTPEGAEPEPDGTEFERPHDFDPRSLGPRGFARMTEGSWTEGGTSQVLDPDPNE